ncbi:MAG TPA: secretin N-terminal domain-containing protein [Candidatus Acidoferrales bacterium]|jgi:general secretion pathway protein D|nr:secretin N-terminal domain-containing protein [Candidatus Acidoferrales bacterium]
MKHITSILLILALTVSVLRAQMPPGMPPGGRGVQPNAASPQDNSDNEIIPPGLIDFQGVDVSQVLEVYAQLERKTLLRAGLPNAQIVLKTETPLTKGEAIQALQAVLALNGISVIDVPGGKFIKVVPTEQASQTGETFNEGNPNQLPELGSYVTRIVQLKYLKPSQILPVIQPFSKSPNAILPIDENGILVLRDYSENVKRMMEMIDKVDVVVPAEYTNEVIPIKYAMADDIASVLSSLENPGGGTTSFGQTSTPGSEGARNGVVGSPIGGSPMGGGINGSQPYGGQNSFQNNQSPQGGGQSPFANRLQNILNKVQNNGGGGGGGANGMQQPIQILGQTKIIADERSNSLLIYATPEDMVTIKDIIKRLDVLLAQVLIESVIMEVDLTKGWSYGISAAQNPLSGPSVNGAPIQGVGAVNNGTPFYNFAGSGATNIWPGNFTSSALPGLSYFGNIGPNWDLALQAAANDSSTHIIQRPRIQTSQAKEAQFFVGQSVPYVTSTYQAGAYGNGGSSYSQLQVGISLDVTPFINPDGLVVLDINQQINDISGNVQIQGVGAVPTTDNRTFTSEVAVKDRDTIVLGGFTDTETDKSSTGVPLLEDIPIIGNLFKSPSSNKVRDELLVMMRPTVLKTPEDASIQAVKEEVNSPGISGAERDEKGVVNQERKSEAATEKKQGAIIEPTRDADGLYTTNNMANP